MTAAVALMVFTAPVARAAVINPLGGWDEDEPGWSGSLAGSYGASGGNSPDTTFEGSGRVQLNAHANVFRLLMSANRKTVRGVEGNLCTVTHLRHNYLLSDIWATLVFGQYQSNPFQRLDSRFLLGFGGRWRKQVKESVRLYLGAAHMLEQERIQGESGHEKAQRLSSFVGMVSNLSESVGFDFLVFYQPRWSDFSDWRTHLEAFLMVDLTDSLQLFTGYMLEYNSLPPEGVEKNDWETKTGFAFNF